MHFIFIISLLVGDFGRTSSLIDIPCPPRYGQGVFGLSISSTFATRRNTSHSNDLDINLKYGLLGKAEVAVSAYTTKNYTASFSYLLKPEKKSAPGIFFGVDDITYTKEVSSTGGTGTGFSDDSMYYKYGGRNPEVFSLYFAGFKKYSPFNFIFGLGRGRFVGYGPRSRFFNTDYYFRSVGPESVGPSIVALGLFMGASIDLMPSLAVMWEFDGRDGNVGLRYRHKYFDLNVGFSKLEQIGMDPIYSPRYSLAFEFNNSFIFEAPKTGILACVVLDAQNRNPVSDVVISISETGKRFRSARNSFELTMPKGKYTLKIEKNGYNPQIKIVQVVPNVKTRTEFLLTKTAEAMRIEAEKLARQEEVQKLLKTGLDYVSSDSLIAARTVFENILKIDSTHAQAKSYLAFVNTRIQDAIVMYMRQAEAYVRQGNIAQAISSYQKVLGLDPNNQVAITQIADLQSRVSVVKKPTPPPKKPTPPPKKPAPPSSQEIEDLYKKGISLFAQEKYDDALKTFKKILALNPNHTGAKNYLRKTEARLKALRGG